MCKKSKKYAESWTLERRRKQRELILKNKPWLKAIGPKTLEGKRKSSQNSVNNFKCLSLEELDKMLEKQKRLIDFLKNPHALDKYIQEIEDDLIGIKELIKGNGTE